MTERSEHERASSGSGGGVRLRLFAALPVAPDQARALAAMAGVIVDRSNGARALAASDLHVTFAFLGSVPEEYVPAVAAALDAAAFSVPGPTGCAVRGAERYGGGRVLGANVHVELHPLLDAARDSFLGAIRAYAPDADARAWRPHISLVRAGRDGTLDEPTDAELVAMADLRWVVGDLRLYASLPGPSGTTYRELHAVPFGAPALRG